MSGVVWSKFYWSDWSNDPTLKTCSLGACGLWVYMLCLMAEAEPIGYLKLKKRQVNPRLLAKVIGRGEEEVELLLKELEEAEVFTRAPDGTIYSRRMIRDDAKRAESRRYGKLGGNPQLQNGRFPRVKG